MILSNSYYFSSNLPAQLFMQCTQQYPFCHKILSNFQVEEDFEPVGLRKEGVDIRRAPVITVEKQEDVQTSTQKSLEKSTEVKETVSKEEAKVLIEWKMSESCMLMLSDHRDRIKIKNFRKEAQRNPCQLNATVKC